MNESSSYIRHAHEVCPKTMLRRSARNSLKPILRSRMVFLDRTEHKAEVMAEKIAVGVPRGEPETAWPISLTKPAIYFLFRF